MGMADKSVVTRTKIRATCAVSMSLLLVCLLAATSSCGQANDATPNPSLSSPPAASQPLDSDADGLPNSEERIAGTSPYSADTDGDGYPDPEDPNPNDPWVPGATPCEETFSTTNDGGSNNKNEYKAIMRILESMPYYVSSLNIDNVNIMRNDNDLQPLWASIESLIEIDDTVGVSYDDVHLMANVHTSSDHTGTLSDVIWVLLGDFDLDDVRDSLSIRDYTKSVYKGIEVWEKPPGYMIALMDDLIIFGDMVLTKDCIDVIKGDTQPMYNLESIQFLLNKLPSGFSFSYDTSGAPELVGLDFYGTMIVKKTSEIIEMTAIFKFQNENDAENSLAWFEESQDVYWHYLQLSCDKEYVTLSFETSLYDL